MLIYFIGNENTGSENGLDNGNDNLGNNNGVDNGNVNAGSGNGRESGNENIGSGNGGQNGNANQGSNNGVGNGKSECYHFLLQTTMLYSLKILIYVLATLFAISQRFHCFKDRYKLFFVSKVTTMREM